MSTQQRIEVRLTAALPFEHLEIANESASHNVPTGSETHFRIVGVSQAFAPMSRIARHRAVNHALAEELADGVHALALHLYTLDEWRARHGDAPLSPPCLGGSAGETS